MDARDLPASILIGVTAEVRTLERLLVHATGNPMATFRGFETVDGTPHTYRILIPNEVLEFGVPFHRPLNCLDAAMEFLHPDFVEKIRLQPTEPPNRHARKGWEIRVAQIWDHSVVIAQAMWVS